MKRNILAAAAALLLVGAPAFARAPYMPATGHADLLQQNMQSALGRASCGKGGHR